MTDTILESVEGQKTIRAYGQEDEYLDIQYYSLGHIKSSLEGIYYDGNIAAYKGQYQKNHMETCFSKNYMLMP